MIDALHLGRPLELLFWLLVLHALCDFPLQGDFLSRAKNHTAPIPGINWQWALGWHALMHAGAVMAATQSYALGGAEFVVHVVIDYLKCGGRTTFHQDQVLHVCCKYAWVGLALWWGIL